MEIRTRLEQEVMHVELEGRMDAAWSGTVGKTLQDTLLVGCHSVVLDLGKVNYLSSAGIRILMLLAKQLKGLGGKLHISEQSAQVREVLDMVGFHKLIEPLPAKIATTTAVPVPQEQPWQWGEHGLAVYELVPGAKQRGTLYGQPLTAAICGAPTVLRIGPDTLALGLGAVGADPNPARAGELLAVGGLAIGLPGDDPAHPDWLVREGGLIPEVRLHYGLSMEGPFRLLIRFGMQADMPPIPLSVLVGAALYRCGGEVASFVILAETANLVGAALQTPPDKLPADWFSFPDVRDRMLFTAESAHVNETALIVGLAARRPSPRLAGLLRGMGTDSGIEAHCHAAIAPYRPVRRGLIELGPSLEGFMQSQLLRGVLHLLNDDREGIGAGESHLRRGALWCAPVDFEDLPSTRREVVS